MAASRFLMFLSCDSVFMPLERTSSGLHGVSFILDVRDCEKCYSRIFFESEISIHYSVHWRKVLPLCEIIRKSFHGAVLFFKAHLAKVDNLVSNICLEKLGNCYVICVILSLFSIRKQEHDSIHLLCIYIC